MLKRKKKNTNSSYQIKNTIHGPLVIFNDEMYFLDQPHQLFDVVDNNPDILFDLNKAIIEHFNSYINPILDSLKERKQSHSLPMASALNAINLYFRFVYHEYFEYRTAVARALFDTNDIEAVFVMNHEKINEFFNLNDKVDQEKVQEYIKKYSEIQ